MRYQCVIMWSLDNEAGEIYRFVLVKVFTIQCGVPIIDEMPAADLRIDELGGREALIHQVQIERVLFGEIKIMDVGPDDAELGAARGVVGIVDPATIIADI